jgi:hypothetical protein
MTRESTGVTPEECTDLAKIMTLKYGAHLGDRVFSIVAQTEKTDVSVVVTLASPSGRFHYPVEARMEAVASQDVTVPEAFTLLLDYVDAYFEEYLQEGSLLPIDWKEYDFEGCTLQIRGQVLNLELERAADALLAHAALEKGTAK